MNIVNSKLMTWCNLFSKSWGISKKWREKLRLSLWLIKKYKCETLVFFCNIMPFFPLIGMGSFIGPLHDIQLPGLTLTVAWKAANVSPIPRCGVRGCHRCCEQGQRVSLGTGSSRTCPTLSRACPSLASSMPWLHGKGRQTTYTYIYADIQNLVKTHPIRCRSEATHLYSVIKHHNIMIMKFLSFIKCYLS